MAALDSPWCSACSLSWLRCAFLFATAFATVRGFEGIQAGPFMGAKSLTLITCTVADATKLKGLQEITLTVKTASSERLLVTNMAEASECNVQDVFATCEFVKYGKPYSVSVVMPNFVKGETVRNFTCKATFDRNGDELSDSYKYHQQLEKDEPATETTETEKGTPGWISTSLFQGQDHIRLVECTRPKAAYLSMGLFRNDTRQQLDNINLNSKSCTTAASVFSSCRFSDAEDDATVRTLLTGLQEGETAVVGCRAFTRSHADTPSQTDTAYVRVAGQDAANAAVSRVAGGNVHIVTMMATWVVVVMTGQLYQD